MTRSKLSRAWLVSRWTMLAVFVIFKLGFDLGRHAETFWIVVAVLAGLALMILTGAMWYRYLLFGGMEEYDGPGALGVMASFFFPVTLPIILMLWLGVWPQRKEKIELERYKRIARMEAEAYGPLRELL